MKRIGERQTLMTTNANDELKMMTEQEQYNAELLAIELEEKRIADKKKQLLIKKHLADKDFQQQFLQQQKVRLTTKINFRDTKIAEARDYIAGLEKEIAEWETKIETFEAEQEKYKEDIEAIEGVDFDEEDLDIEGFIADNFKEEAITYIEEQLKPKPAPQPKKTSMPHLEKKLAKIMATPLATEGEQPEKKKREQINRKDYAAKYLPNKMVLIASANKKGTKEKITKTIIYNKNANTFHLYDQEEVKIYPTLTAANIEWCEERGLTKDRYENAWEAFKALNLMNPKEKRSIQHLHTDDWIADSISEAADFIDAEWTF